MKFLEMLQEITQIRVHKKKMKGGKVRSHKKNKDTGFTDQGPTGLTAGPERKQ